MSTPSRRRPPHAARPCATCNTPHLRESPYCYACAQTLTNQRNERHNQQRASLHTPEWQRIRAAILTRDHHTCVICAHTTPLQVHHINHNGDDHRADNLVTLCARCHTRVESEYVKHRNGEYTQKLNEHLANSPHHTPTVF